MSEIPKSEVDKLKAIKDRVTDPKIKQSIEDRLKQINKPVKK